MELWDAYYKDGTLANRTLVRGEPVPKGLYHLVVNVLVRHEDGEYLLMLRDPNKETWPGVYEPSAGGSALKGENELEAAIRELREETGIARGTFVPLLHEVGDECYYADFLCETDWPKDGIVLQAGETVGYRWVSREELCAMMEEVPLTVVVQPGMKAWIRGE